MSLNFSSTYYHHNHNIEDRGQAVSSRFLIYIPIFIPTILINFFLVFLRLFNHIPGEFLKLGHDHFLPYVPQPTVYCRGTQIPDARWRRRLNFVRWRLIFAGPQCGTDFLSPHLRLELWRGYWVFWKFVHSCFFNQLVIWHYIIVVWNTDKEVKWTTNK